MAFAAISEKDHESGEWRGGKLDEERLGISTQVETTCNGQGTARYAVACSPTAFGYSVEGNGHYGQEGPSLDDHGCHGELEMEGGKETRPQDRQP